MKYKVGDKVRIKSLDWYKIQCMDYNYVIIDFMNSCWCGYEMTIVETDEDFYYMKEDDGLSYWTDEMIECKVEDEMSLDKAGQITDFEYEGLAYTLPEGYQFVDENGNVINATKIVLEKKKGLTQEQINAMVHDSCVSFCKHCGCGVPRETCTSLGTCKEHDEYRTAIRTCLMKKNKKK